ncbi:MAG: UDP-glucose dehydrogenase family protein [Fastidiosipilaceae bacterium]
MKIAVAGTGYVGLVTGVCLADKGHEVTCVDVDENKIKTLSAGRSPIYEVDLEELMSKNQSRLTYTTDYASAYEDAEVIFIGVGTPEKSDGSANLQYVYAAVEQIAETVRRDCVVAIKSTVPIGTNDRIEEFLNDRLVADVKVSLVSNPEFLAQGTAVRDSLHASRIVVGANEDEPLEIMRELYKDFDAPLLTCDRNSAEMIKYASNDFLALKISYINEIANLCEIVGADVRQVSRGMGLDPRIGDRFLNAGIGYGGSCFPKDTKALHWLAIMNDYELKTVKAAIEVNEQQKLRMLKQLRRVMGNLRGRKVAVLGLTFKAGTDDLREAPSLVNVPILLEDGAEVRAYDPVSNRAFATLMERQKVQDADKVTYHDTPEAALSGADACIILTEWPQIKALTATDFIRQMSRPLVLDGRNCFDPMEMRVAGVEYHCVGYGR